MAIMVNPKAVQVVRLTAQDVWDLRSPWHRLCSEKNHANMSDAEHHHLAVCDALESLARDLESRGDDDNIAHFTSKVLDFPDLMSGSLAFVFPAR